MNFSTQFDPAKVEWHHIIEAADETGFSVNYEYSILGYDLNCGRLDMLMRFRDETSNCERHGHAASTTTLILEGEQRLKEHQPDGSFKDIVRKKGDYALAAPDALPHIEGGGPDGCTLMLSLHAPTGNLFSVYDANFDKLGEVPIEDFVARWTLRNET